MSNRRRPSEQTGRTVLDDLAAQLGDRRLPGGCDDCDAFQTMTKTAEGVYSVTVHHDETCPFIRGRVRR